MEGGEEFGRYEYGEYNMYERGRNGNDRKEMVDHDTRITEILTLWDLNNIVLLP